MASDDFNRSNEDPVGSPWTACGSFPKPALISSQLRNNTGSDQVCLAYRPSTADDSQFTISTVGGTDSFPAVLDADGNGYTVDYAAPFEIRLMLLDVGAFYTNIGSYETTVADGDTIRIRRDGDDVVVYHNTVERIRVADTSYTAVFSGVHFYDQTARLDDWTDNQASGFSLTVDARDIAMQGQSVPLNLGIVVAHAQLALQGQSLLAQLALPATARDIVIAGQEVALQASSDFTLGVDVAQLAVQGQSVSAALTMPLAAADVALAGQDVALQDGNSYTLGLDVAQLALAGQSLVNALTVVVTHRDIALTGYTIVEPITMPVTTRQLAVAGQEIPFILTQPGSASQIAVAGQEVALQAGSNFSLSVNHREIALAGQSLTNATSVMATPAQIVVSGQSLLLNSLLPITAQPLALQGQDIGFLSPVSLPVDSGSIAMAGEDVSLLADSNFSLSVDVQQIAVEGEFIGMSLYTPLAYQPLAIAGQEILFDTTNILLVTPAQIAVRGSSISLLYSGIKLPDIGGTDIGSVDVGSTGVGRAEVR